MILRPCSLAVAAMTVALAAAAAAPAPVTDTLAISIQAFLFNSRTGALSRDVLTLDGGIGNAPSSEYASVSTLVVVKPDFGTGRPVPAGAKVRLVATVRGKVLLDRTSRIGPVAADGTTYVGFWLADTGCQPIDIKATLVGARGAAGSASLPFACYE